MVYKASRVLEVFFVASVCTNVRIYFHFELPETPYFSRLLANETVYTIVCILV